MSSPVTPSWRRFLPVLLPFLVFVIGAFVFFGLENRESANGHGTNQVPADLLVGEMKTFIPAAPAKKPATFVFVDEGREDKPEKTLDAYKGQVILVNFWATWCAPCRVEMPSLSRLQTAMGSKDFKVVTLSLDRKGREKVQPFFDKLNLTNLPVYVDRKSKSLRALGLRGLPVTMLIGRDGKEIGRVTGPAEWDSPEAQALIKSQL